jgi:N utilization substance protein B
MKKKNHLESPKPLTIRHIRARASRLAAVQALYQADQTDESVSEILNEYLMYPLGRLIGDERLKSKSDPVLLRRIVETAVNKQNDIDHIISSFLTKDWRFERLELVIKAILRAGVSELFEAAAPTAVILSEYVDITHSFYGGKEPSFVNGILDRISRSLT